jgi:folate-binding protein YgfZ
MNSTWIEDYRQLRQHCAAVDLADWTLIEARGADTAAVLNSLSSNNVQGLEPWRCCEAFFCSVQGKIVGHAWILRLPERFLLIGAAGQDSLATQLDRYVIREDVRFQPAADRAMLLAGPAASQLLGAAAEPLAARGLELGGGDCVAMAVDWLDVPAELVIGAPASLQQWQQQLAAEQIPTVSPAAWEAARIESVFPLYGADITAEFFPQEVGRDEAAISFTKGCYLGQETVARIDALGHVNWKLGLARFQQLPSPGAPLQLGEKAVGRVLSASDSPQHQSPVALVRIRREVAPGTELAGPAGPAVLIS